RMGREGAEPDPIPEEGAPAPEGGGIDGEDRHPSSSRQEEPGELAGERGLAGPRRSRQADPVGPGGRGARALGGWARDTRCGNRPLARAEALEQLQTLGLSTLHEGERPAEGRRTTRLQPPD